MKTGEVDFTLAIYKPVEALHVVAVWLGEHDRAEGNKPS